MSLALFDDPPAFPLFDLGPHRLAEYEELPETPRCELIFGRFYVSPSPSLLHQIAALVLWRALDGLARPTRALAVAAPFDVALFDHSVVQPDVLYFSAARRRLVRARAEGPPDLVVEVVSPGSARTDRVQKLRLYAEAGVQEYWVVDIAGRQIEFLDLHDGYYRVVLPEGPIYQSANLPEIRLDLETYWREVEERLSEED